MATLPGDCVRVCVRGYVLCRFLVFPLIICSLLRLCDAYRIRMKITLRLARLTLCSALWLWLLVQGPILSRHLRLLLLLLLRSITVILLVCLRSSLCGRLLLA